MSNYKMATNNKPAQILQLTPPNEIVFSGPFESRVVTSYLELHNPSIDTICFKVKTTAPRRYCVRPNSGTVEPGCKVRIAIMLQPMEDETPNERVRHKFMVQSTILQQDTKNLDSVWAKISPDQIMDSKLRCVFESPETNAAESKPTSATNTSAIPETASTNTSEDTTKTSPSTNSMTQHQSSSTLQQTTVSQKPQQTAGDGQSTSKIKETKSFAPTPSSASPIRKSDAYDANKSVASSSNLTSSFLQPMSDDYKIVLVSLVMLFIGVILGKYII